MNTNEAATQAIVSHIMDGLEREHGRELRIALLVRDALDRISARIIARFLIDLKGNLAGDPDMEWMNGGSFDKAPMEKNASIGWRHKDWPRGIHIGLSFEQANLRRAFYGVCAPSENDLDGSAQMREDYYVLPEEVRHAIFGEVERRSAIPYKGPTSWYPVYNYFEPPMHDWTSTDALLRIAKIDQHDGQYFVDWVTNAFVELRASVDEVLRST
jgi:uncharacterized protein (DUF427 family)